MGVTFGQMEGLEMAYERVGSRSCEVRKYESYFVAEVECNDDKLKEACQALERYIGRFCEPENVKGSPIASIPGQLAIITERIPFRVPVIREKNTIQFVLPAIYANLQQVPVPTNPLVKVRQVPERIVGVLTFYGLCLRKQYQAKLQELHDMLNEDDMLNVSLEDQLFPRLIHRKGQLESHHGTRTKHYTTHNGHNGTLQPLLPPVASAVRDAAGQPAPAGECVADSVQWSVAQYHPRQTCRCLRRNEVWIDLSRRNPEVADLLYSN